MRSGHGRSTERFIWAGPALPAEQPHTRAERRLGARYLGPAPSLSVMYIDRTARCSEAGASMSEKIRERQRQGGVPEIPSKARLTCPAAWRAHAGRAANPCGQPVRWSVAPKRILCGLCVQPQDIGMGLSRHRNTPSRHGRRMSKARLVITAVITEGRSQGEVARTYGVSQSWVSRLVAGSGGLSRVDSSSPASKPGPG